MMPAVGEIQGPADICVGQTYSFTVAPLPNAVYTWTAANGTILSGQGTNTVTAKWAEGGYNALYVDILLPTTVTLSDSHNLISHSAMPVNMGPNGAYCGQSLWLTPGNGYNSYLWQNGGTVDTLWPNAPGMYWVEVTDANGCTARDTVTLHPNVPTPAIIPPGPIQFCEGNSAMVFGPSGFASYLWNGMDIGQAAMVDQSMTLTLTVVDSLGCIASSAPTTVTALERPEPVIVFAADTLWATPLVGIWSSTYEWHIDGVPTTGNLCWHVPSQTANYKVVVTDSNGCEGISSAYWVNTVSTDIPFAGSLNVWPNPAQGSFQVALPEGFVQGGEIQVFDPAGRQVQAPTRLGAQNSITVMTESLSTGLYLVQVRNEAHTWSTRVLVQD